MRNLAWKKLRFISPERFLRGITQPQEELDGHSIQSLSRNLKHRRVRTIEEDRRCAILCYGITEVTGKKVIFSDFESSDYDYVLAAEHDGHTHFIPLQMKQLVPVATNATASLQNEINKLRKYSCSTDLIVAIHINRKTNIIVENLDLQGLPIKELWLFGAEDPASSTWILIGNLLEAPYGAYRFRLPARA